MINNQEIGELGQILKVNRSFSMVVKVAGKFKGKEHWAMESRIEAINQ